jgi:antitoxin component of RelBE/YafQ-DinJ toxin-antitoxin module
LRGKIIGLVVEVLIRLRANDVASTHRIPVLFRRSSNRRCLSSQ